MSAPILQPAKPVRTCKLRVGDKIRLTGLMFGNKEWGVLGKVYVVTLARKRDDCLGLAPFGLGPQTAPSSYGTHRGDWFVKLTPAEIAEEVRRQREANPHLCALALQTTAQRFALKGPKPRKLAAFRLPPATLAKIKAGARAHGYSQADYIRDCVDLFPAR